MSFSSPWDEEDEQEEADISFADPAIRQQYEAALGAFILAFNHVDYFVGKLLRLETDKRGKSHLYDAKAGFYARLQILEAFAAQSPELASVPFPEMRKLNQARNTLAHGHFDQNPFDGSYSILEKQKISDFPIGRLTQLTLDLNGVAKNLNFAWAQYQFDELL
jgi:hypothetical protein